MRKEKREKNTRRMWRYGKKIIFLVKRQSENTLPVFIMGCGRSGTSMMIDIFHRDYRVDALGENDKKIAKNFIIDFKKVPSVIEKSKASVIVMKPILNSFDALYVLKNYKGSKVLWFIREYKDMVASSIKKFGGVVPGYIKDFVLHQKGNNWLSRGMPYESREVILSLNISEFSQNDWMALVWWSVNNTIILDKLNEYNRFYIVRYETLVNNPESELMNIYKFIGLKYKNKASKYIDSISVGKGYDIELHPQVLKLCQNLTDKIFV